MVEKPTDLEAEQACSDPDKPNEDSPAAEPVVVEQQSAAQGDVSPESVETKEEPPVDQKATDAPLPPVHEPVVVEKPADLDPAGDDKKLDGAEPVNEDKLAQKSEPAPGDAKGDEYDEGKDTVGPILGEKQAAVKTGENLHTTPDILDSAHDLGESVSRSDEDVAGNGGRREESTGLTGERSPADCGGDITSTNERLPDVSGEEGVVSQDQLEGVSSEDRARSDDLPPIIATAGNTRAIETDGLGPHSKHDVATEPIRDEIPVSEPGISGQPHSGPTASFVVNNESPVVPPEYVSNDNDICGRVDDLSGPLNVPVEEKSTPVSEIPEISAVGSPLEGGSDSSHAARDFSVGPTQRQDSMEVLETDLGDNTPVLGQAVETQKMDVIDASQPAPEETGYHETGNHETPRGSPRVTSIEPADTPQQAGEIPAPGNSGIGFADRSTPGELPVADEDDFVLISSSEVPDKVSLEDSQTINPIGETGKSNTSPTARIELSSDHDAKLELSSGVAAAAPDGSLRNIEPSGGDVIVHDGERPVERTGDSQNLAIVEESGAVGSTSNHAEPVLAEDQAFPSTEASAGVESAEKLPVLHESGAVAMKEDIPMQQPPPETQDKTPSTTTEPSTLSEGTGWRGPYRRRSQARRARDVPALFWPDRTVLVSRPVEDNIDTPTEPKGSPAVRDSSSRWDRETLRADSPVIPGMLPRPAPPRIEAETDLSRSVGHVKGEQPTLEPQRVDTPAQRLDNSSAGVYPYTKSGLGLETTTGGVVGGSSGLAIAHHAADKVMDKKPVRRATRQESPRIAPQQRHLSESLTNMKPSGGKEAFPVMNQDRGQALDPGTMPKNGVPLRTRKSHLTALDLGQERSDTPPIVIPTMADLPPVRPPARARQLRRARKMSIARAEEEIAAAVVIYASADALSPPGSPTRETRPFHFPEDGLSREPSSAARPQDWQTDSPKVIDGHVEDEDLRQSVADLFTDNDRPSGDRDRERRRRRRSSHHHSRSSRDGESESRRHSHSSSHSHRHHRSRADSERSSRTPPDMTPPRTPTRSRRHDSGYGGEDPERSRRHRRSPEEQADHERRRERRLREKEREGERDRRESRDSDRERHRRSRPGTSRSNRDFPTDDSPPKKLLDFEYARGVLAGPKDAPHPPSASSRGDLPRRSNTARRSRRSEDVSGRSHRSRTGDERVRRRSEERPRSGDKMRSVDRLRSDDKMRSGERLRSDEKMRSDDRLRSEEKMRSEDRLPRKGEGDGSRAEEARRRAARHEERMRAKEKDDEKRSGFRAAIKRIFN